MINFKIGSLLFVFQKELSSDVRFITFTAFLRHFRPEGLGK